MQAYDSIMCRYSCAGFIDFRLAGKTLTEFINLFSPNSTNDKLTTGSISIASFATVIGAPVETESESLGLTFSISTGIVKKLLKTTINKNKKHNKIVMLARSKLNSIERKISEALINNEISHKDFITLINEEKNIDN